MAKVFKRKIVDTKFLPSQWQWGKMRSYSKRQAIRQ